MILRSHIAGYRVDEKLFTTWAEAQAFVRTGRTLSGTIEPLYAAPPAAEPPDTVAVPRELLREALAWLEVNDAGYPTKELRALLAGGAE